MRDAIEEHNKTGGSIASLARKHDVADESLRRRILGIVSEDAKTGRVQGLQSAEEDALAHFAIQMCERGLGLTRPMIKERVMSLVQNHDHAFNQSGPSPEWMRGFLERHPGLSLRTPEKMSTLRSKNAVPDVINAHFDTLQTIVTEYHYQPSMIWNADETSGRTNGKEDKVFAAKGEPDNFFLKKTIKKTKQSNKTKIKTLLISLDRH